MATTLSRPRPVTPTGEERTFGHEEIIVSKTDPKGRITYVNDVFLRVSGYERSELMGAPHSIIRHPQAPRGLFKLLWDTISSGSEIFAYVPNMASDGARYWVLAHVTPTRNAAGQIVGYHSNRRSPARAAVATMEPIYARMKAAEAGIRNAHEASIASEAVLLAELAAAKVSYDEFIWGVICASKAV